MGTLALMGAGPTAVPSGYLIDDLPSYSENPVSTLYDQYAYSGPNSITAGSNVFALPYDASLWCQAAAFHKMAGLDATKSNHQMISLVPVSWNPSATNHMFLLYGRVSNTDPQNNWISARIWNDGDGTWRMWLSRNVAGAGMEDIPGSSILEWDYDTPTLLTLECGYDGIGSIRGTVTDGTHVGQLTATETAGQYNTRVGFGMWVHPSVAQTITASTFRLSALNARTYLTYGVSGAGNALANNPMVFGDGVEDGVAYGVNANSIYMYRYGEYVWCISDVLGEDEASAWYYYYDSGDTPPVGAWSEGTESTAPTVTLT